MTAPMFPLGSVLLPGAPLGLSVFEPRYLVMIEQCLAGDARFGVVLIERGSEVGGGDVRCQTGTMASIVRAAPIEEGRWRVLAVGEERVRVVEWLPDDPFPRAEIEVLGDGSPPSRQVVTGLGAALHRLLDARSRAGAGATATFADPGALDAEARHQFVWGATAIVAPGPFDAQHLLECETGDDRAEVLTRLADEAAELLRLSTGEQ